MSLRSQANLVRNATQVDPPENDEERVGGLFQEIAKATETVDTISDLKAYADSTSGDFIAVKGYNSAWDGGGGLFKRVETGEIVTGQNVGSGGSSVSYSFSTNDYPLDVIDGTQIPWTHRGNDRLIYENGAIHLPDGWKRQGDSNDSWFTDASISVSSGDKAFIMPEREGWRVLPTFGAYNNNFYWERVLESGEASPEMFGAVRSPEYGDATTATDCADALQGLCDSPYNAVLSGGYYYITKPVYVDYQMDIRGVNKNLNIPVPNDLKLPSRLSDQKASCIWSDKDTDYLIIRNVCNITKVAFSTEFVGASEGYYNSIVLNYIIMRPMLNGDFDQLYFSGNPDIADNTGVGGTAIRYNLEDGDLETARPRGTTTAGGYLSFHHVKRTYIQWFNIGVKGDAIPSGKNVYLNQNHWDITFNRVKQGYRILSGGVHSSITGDYFQAGDILTYDERDTPAMYFRNTNAIFDLRFGDMRTDIPLAGDDPADYPQAHYVNYAINHDGGLRFKGESMFEYPTTTQVVGETKFIRQSKNVVSGDALEGQNYFYRDRPAGSFHSHWTENQILYAETKLSVQYEALTATSGFDFENETDSQIGTLSTASNVSTANFSNLFKPTGLAPEFTFNTGADTNLDFIEIVVDASANNFNRAGYLYITGEIESNAIQAIYKNGGVVQLERYIDTSNASSLPRTFEILAGDNENVDEIIIRFIGTKTIGETSRIFDIRLLNSLEIQQLPWVPLTGGKFYGNVEAESLTITNGSQVDSDSSIITKTQVSLTQAEILDLNATPKVLPFNSDRLIVGWYLETTSGTTNYDTNTNVRIRQATSDAFTYLTFDLANLPGSGNRNVLQLPMPTTNNNILNTTQDMDIKVDTGNPLNGDKEFTITFLHIPI